MKIRLAICGLLVLAIACEGTVEVGSDNPAFDFHPPMITPAQPPPEDPVTPSIPVDVEEPYVVEFSAEEVRFYFSRIAQILVSRPLNAQEAALIDAQAYQALVPILEGWGQEEGFAEFSRFMMQVMLRASGQRDGVDFDLPGNLAAHVTRQQLPVSELLTADYCINGAGEEMECDTGAPFTAGVLGTRAFLAGNASRFNLGRASRMLKVFACRGYPMERSLQPPLEQEILIDMFRADSVEEQMVAEAQDGFGNGSACYTCHSQFGAHAQLYVKFDQTGLYRPEATGLQDPEGELGRSVDGLMTSHLSVPEMAASESSQMFGEYVDNLFGAAQILAESEVLIPCMVRNLIEHTFGLTDSAAALIAAQLLQEISQRAYEREPMPTFQSLLIETFSDPRIVNVVLRTSGDTP